MDDFHFYTRVNEIADALDYIPGRIDQLGVVLHNAEKGDIYIRNSSTHIVVSSSLPHGTYSFIRSKAPSPIRISVKKPLHRMVNEIISRYLHGYTPVWLEALKLAEELNAYKEKVLKTNQELKKLLPTAASTSGEGENEYLQVRVNSDNSFKVLPSSEGVRIEGYLDHKIITEVFKLLASYTK